MQPMFNSRCAGDPQKAVLLRFAVVVMACITLCGCSHFPINKPLARYEPDTGYRFTGLSHPKNSDSLLVILAFSGGGMRAAALSYGVLEELSRIQIEWEGERRRLLDEVDTITAVSGGSFTAAYYGLYGDGIFKDYERKFLRKDIEASLIWSILSPLSWPRLASRTFGRSDIASEFYDQYLFGHKTYAELLRNNHRPFVMINATDISLGARFEFTQDQFDLIGSDLSSFPIGRAVAASAAYPVLLSPVTLRNYGSPAGWHEPAWIRQVMEDANSSPRRRMKAEESRAYQVASERPYIHLLDGGLADNLGLRGPLDATIAYGDTSTAMKAFQLNNARKVVLIVVDAEVIPDKDASRSEVAPGVRDVLQMVSRVPIKRYSFETLELTKESLRKFVMERKAALPATRRISTQAGATADDDGVDLYVANVTFSALKNDSERDFFEGLPTSLTLPSSSITRLRAVAARLLRESPDFQKLMRDLAPSPKAPRRQEAAK